MKRETLVKGCLLLLGMLALSPQVLLGAQNPILLVGTSSNQFSLYYSEVLRAEGLNSFDTADISTVTAGTLGAYDVVILGQMTLTSGQVTMFTNWVNGGGNLIAMRPDKQLAPLLSLSDTGTTLSNAYLQVNTSAAPGAGIVGETIQFHGTADLYVLSGASAVAMLYSTATAATAYPAVTLRTGIGAGGNAAAFTYDLAQSIVYTRQGNPAWAGQRRIGQGGPVRAADMYYGNATFDPQPDWVDLNKIAIPQADEQQRLLANIILYLNQGKKPLPRFWYFPFGKKAAVIMTGDDHAGGATAGRFDDFIASSPDGCSVANWECVRATSYLFLGSPLTNAQAITYSAQGFEVALHVASVLPPDISTCADFTYSSLDSLVTEEIASWVIQYPGVPALVTNRSHCIPWSDWASQALVELKHGVRFDTNYYYWPPSWVVPTPGFFTGSGIPMRFAQTDGTLIDVYQATTQMTDESGQVYPDTINGLLDNAVGTAGFYGAFTANMHNDENDAASQEGADQIVAAAQDRDVPVVSAKQMLEWVDGRNGSSFGSVSWSGNTLTFTITTAAGANGLQAMLPVATTVAGLSSLTLGGAPVSYSVQAVKGILYAFFSAVPGSYQATYAAVLPPVITAVTATPGSTTATISWTTDKNSTSQVDYGTTPSLDTSVSNTSLVTAHTINLSGLALGTTYYFRVTSVDGSGNSASLPLTPATSSFTTIDPTPLAVTAVTAVPGTNGTAAIIWTTNKLASSRVDYGTTSGSLTLNVSDSTMVSDHSLTLTGLAEGATYYYRVTSVDALSNSVSSPAVPAANSFVENAAISVWSSSATPSLVDSGDSTAVELGMKFRSDVAGSVTGVRFYKAAANTGTHTGHLWSSTGTQLGSVTFTNETASGWQQANFATPIAIAANTTYIISYFAPVGRYSANDGFFTSAGVNNPPLHALATGVDGPNGVYHYGTTSGFPNSSWSDSNYWVDLVFLDNVPPVISAVAVAPSLTGATITWTTNEAATSRVDYGTTTALGTTVPNATLVTAHSIALTGLATGTTYYYRVTSVDAFGNSATLPVLTSQPGSFTPTDTAPPVITAVTAAAGSTTATITWNTDKSSSSQVEYGITTALGTPVSNATLVTAHSIALAGLATGTTYYYRVTSTDGSGNSASLPVSPATASFTTTDTIAPVISAVTATPGSGGAATITWTTNEASTSRVDYGTTTTLGTPVSDAGLVTAHSIALAGLATGTTYYYRVTSLDGSGNSASLPVSPATNSFIENAAMSVWSSSTTPSTVDSGDGSAVELGMKFRSDAAGSVTGVRFYKAAANTGTHTGHLWSSTGTLLGSVTFTNETASGWQQANFAAPIVIAANTTYVISYFAPVGRYSVNSGYFTSAGANNGPLHALATGVDGANGLFHYGSASGFPNAGWNDTNYWVDLVFFDNVPPVITAVAVAPSLTGATITWTTNEAATSRVDYGTTTALGTTVPNATLVTAHSIALTGLATGTTYYYRVTSVDAFGNSATLPVLTSQPGSFTPTDTAPPVITAVTAAAGSTTATITWNTDKSSSSQVEYGITTALGTAVSNATLVTAHSIALAGLATGTTYYYRVTSTDGSGNSTSLPVSPATASFTTTDTIAPVISAVTATPGSGGAATITWTTNEASTSRVDYGTTTTLGTPVSDAGLVTAHSIALAGLATGTTYYYRVTSLDGSGNSASLPVSPATNSFIENAAMSVWSSSTTPSTVDSGDGSAVELGMKFRSDAAGSVTGVRFYKAAANTGTHTGHLWSSTGTLLGSVTFTNETASGWQQANFAAPIVIAANTTYVISYFAPVGRYSVNSGYFTSAGANNGPLHALATGVDGANGLFHYGSASGFPNAGWNDTNYWVDLVFFDNVPPVITAVAAAPSLTGATITWTTNEAATSRVDYGTTTALGTTVSNATLVTAHSIALTGLSTGTTYYYRVTSVDAFGNSATLPVATDPPGSFTPTDTTPPVITAVTATPGSTTATITWNTDKSSTSQVDYGPTTALGTTVTSATLVTTHSIALTGLASGATYYYRVTSVDGSGHSASLPVSPATASFITIDTIAPVISAVTATPGSGGAATITWTTNEAATSRVDYGTTTALGTSVPNSALVTAHSLSLSGLTAGATYYYRVTSADSSGNSASLPVSPATNSFIENVPTSVWSSSPTPSLVDSGDGTAVELGMKFRSDVAGTVSGVRFYKAATNTGTHTGHLWNSTGTQLGSVTFTNETASGWQQVNFATPIAISANTTYVISYFAPNGHYSANSGFFTSAGVNTPPLHALATGVDGVNGVFHYGSASGFPNAGWNDSNYWVDLIFLTGDPTPPIITAFTVPATASSLIVPISSFTATDAIGVTGYMVTESATAPSSGAAGWTATAPTSYTATTAGAKTLYAWAMDAAGNVSASRSASVVITLSDSTPPIITAFTIPATASSLTVPINSFIATDNIGVTGYMVTESATAPSAGATGWLTPAPASYTATTAGAKTLYAWAKDAAGNVSAGSSAQVVITVQATGPELAGWYAGDMHVHRSCGAAPETVSAMYSKMATNNLAVMSLLADMGNGEVQNATTDLPLVNGTDASVSTPGHIVHWDTEWHWDPTYTQYAHQAIGGHIVALGLTSAQQVWQEYTYPILTWAHQQNGIAGFAHMQYLDSGIPQSLSCCSPIEYPVEVALGAADFISEDVDDSGSGIAMYPDSFIQAYYKLLNTGFRPGFAAGTDYPCNNSRPVGSLLTYVQPAGGQMTYRNWINGIAAGRTVISRNGHNEFMALTVNGTATPGDEIRLATGGSVTVTVQWSAAQSLAGTIELVSNGVVVASTQASVSPGAPATWSTAVSFPQSGWLAARRMGSDGHQVHTAAVFVIVNNAPIRASAADAEFYVQWMDALLANTSAGGIWNSYFPTSLSQAQARYQAAKTVFQQIEADAAGTSNSPGIFTTQEPTIYYNEAAYELGTKFWADVNGQIAQVRLYTNALEGGSHTVRIWRASDSTLLAGPYTWNITSGTEGWKTFTLSSPLSIVANTDYIVDISNSSDHYYAAQNDGFDVPIVNGHLHTYVGSGVFATTLGTMPTSTWQNSNYFRDIVFAAAQ